jgi:hypothetical protein
VGYSGELLGAYEAQMLLGLGRSAFFERVAALDFPEPLVRLRSGPVWSRAQLEEYARMRAERYVERPWIQELAAASTFALAPSPVSVSVLEPARGGVEGDDGVMTVAEAARVLDLPAWRLEEILRSMPGPPAAVWDIKTGRLRGVRRDSLGVLARMLGQPMRETAA